MVALFVILFILTCVAVDYFSHRKQYKQVFAAPADVMYSPRVGFTMADGGKPAQFAIHKDGETKTLTRITNGESTPVGCFANSVTDEEIGKMVRALNT